MITNLFLANSGPNLTNALNPVWQIVCTIIPLLLSVVSVFGIFKCVSLGLAYARSDENGTHEKAKKDLINAIVGFTLIFVLTAVLWAVRAPMIEWLSSMTNEFNPAEGS